MEIRATIIEDKKIIEGYFALFDNVTTLTKYEKEKISKNTFQNSINSKREIKALFNHDSNIVLGSSNNNTLDLKEDEKGLWGTIYINEDDEQALSVYQKVKRGDITGCSFGFEIVKQKAKKLDNKTIMYILEDVKLYEVSICTFPAYKDTTIYARSLKKSIEDKKEKLLKKIKGE